jgi:hypothetical protein
MARRHLLLLPLALALLSVPVASAARPTIEPAPFEPLSGRFCPDFDVLVSAVVNKGKAITFSNGATIVHGRLVADVTNLSNNKTIRINVSGPAFISSDGSQVRVRGRTLLVGEAGFFGAGAPPTLTLLSGRGLITVGPEGPTGLSVTGRTKDLCPVLADP